VLCIVELSAVVSELESESALETALAGVPRVAGLIASLSAEDRHKAFAAAERSYYATAVELGFPEGQAQGWATVLLAGLRRELDALTQVRTPSAL
jgi:hypothetical protein